MQPSDTQAPTPLPLNAHLAVSATLENVRGADVVAHPELQLAFRQALADTLFLPLDNIGPITTLDQSAPVVRSNDTWAATAASAAMKTTSRGRRAAETQQDPLAAFSHGQQQQK
jgi:hypothetical protein